MFTLITKSCKHSNKKRLDFFLVFRHGVVKNTDFTKMNTLIVNRMFPFD